MTYLHTNVPLVPPMPPDAGGVVVWTLAVAGLLVGMVLLGWGRKFQRLLAGGVGAGVAWGIAPMVSDWAGVGVLWVRVAAMVTLGLLAIVLARVVWAASLAALLGGIVALVTTFTLAARAPLEHLLFVTGPYLGASFWEWSGRSVAHVGGLGYLVWQDNAVTLILAGGIVALVVFVVAVLLRRWVTILMTSLIGSVVVVSSAVLAAGNVNRQYWPSTPQALVAPLAAVGAMLVLSTALQILLTVREDRRRKADEEERKKQLSRPHPAATPTR